MGDFNIDLSKSNPSGKDIGKAYVQIVIDNYKKASTGEFADVESDLKSSILQKAESLPESEVDDYRNYYAIVDYISRERGFANSNAQLCISSCFQLQMFLSRLATTEKVIDVKKTTPLIMTTSQYCKYVDAVHRQRQERLVRFPEFLYAVYEHFKSEPGLKQQIERVKAIPVYTKEMLKKYKNVCKSGYYTYKGLRSDQCDKLTWNRAIDEAIIEAVDDNDLLFIKSSSDDIALSFALLKGGKKPLKNVVLSDIIDNVEWIEAPASEPLTMGVILDNLGKFFPALINSGKAPATIKKEILEFKELFPGIYNDLLRIAKSIAPEIDFFNKDRQGQYNYVVAPAGWLASTRVLERYKETINNIDSLDIADVLEEPFDRYRAKWNGIAVLDNNDYTGADGNYEPLESIERTYTLDMLCDEAPSLGEGIKELRSIIFNSAREVFAYNRLLKTVEEITGLNITTFSVEEEEMLERLEYLNVDVMGYLVKVKSNSRLFNKEEAERRNRYSEDLFQVINLEAAEPTGKAVAELKKYLAEHKDAFRNHIPTVSKILKQDEQQEQIDG